MARDFKALVRLNDWEVDQKRRALGEELRQLDNLEGNLSALDSEVVREKAAAEAMPTEGGIMFGAYAEVARARREDLERRIVEQQASVEHARDHLSAAYLELKKYEIAEETRVNRIDAEEARAEQADLDEIGITAHIRKS
tara:strand:- start:127170 stop:127589 length:420 start_codon:yes stop_codon:yes gene_type:complete